MASKQFLIKIGQYFDMETIRFLHHAAALLARLVFFGTPPIAQRLTLLSLCSSAEDEIDFVAVRNRRERRSITFLCDARF